MKKTLSQNRTQFLNISKWVSRNQHKVSPVELKAFHLMREDIMIQTKKSDLEFLEDCLSQIRKWELYKKYRYEHPYYQREHICHLKELSRINVKMLLLIHNYKNLRIDYQLNLLREKKVDLKKKIESIYK